MTCPATVAVESGDTVRSRQRAGAAFITEIPVKQLPPAKKPTLLFLAELAYRASDFPDRCNRLAGGYQTAAQLVSTAQRQEELNKAVLLIGPSRALRRLGFAAACGMEATRLIRRALRTRG